MSFFPPSLLLYHPFVLRASAPDDTHLSRQMEGKMVRMLESLPFHFNFLIIVSSRNAFCALLYLFSSNFSLGSLSSVIRERRVNRQGSRSCSGGVPVFNTIFRTSLLLKSSSDLPVLFRFSGSSSIKGWFPEIHPNLSSFCSSPLYST